MRGCDTYEFDLDRQGENSRLFGLLCLVYYRMVELLGVRLLKKRVDNKESRSLGGKGLGKGVVRVRGCGVLGFRGVRV